MCMHHRSTRSFTVDKHLYRRKGNLSTGITEQNKKLLFLDVVKFAPHTMHCPERQTLHPVLSFSLIQTGPLKSTGN